MRLILPLLAFFLPISASADWKEVRSDHFLIYANDSDNGLKKRAERLEAVHYLMLRANGLTEDTNPVRVKVYFYGDIPTVAKLSGVGNAAGYYSTSESGAIAVVPAGDDPETFNTLFHEYAHHFMLQYFPAAYPSWYIEGWAELIGSTSFERKGFIGYGKVNNGRKVELDYGVWTHAGDIVAKPRSELRKTSSQAFYGQSWLITHYLTLSSERSAKLRAYLAAIGRGAGQEAAAKLLGEPDQFNRDVRAYFSRGVFEYKSLPMPEALTANLSMRSLSASEIALVKDDIAFQSDSNPEDRAENLATLRNKAAKFPNDRYAQQLLGMAEYASENYETAAKIADTLLAIAPDSPRALLLKARADLQLAKDSPESKERFAAARAMIAKANAADPNDPLPFITYFDSYGLEGRQAPKSVVDGLREAVRLVPQEDSLRFKLAVAVANSNAPGSVSEVVRLLTPIAYDPHRLGNAAAAQEFINTLTGIKQVAEEEVEEGEVAAEPVAAAE